MEPQPSTPRPALTIWQILLACFLAVYGLINVTNIRFDGTNIILGVLAIACAICLFVRK
jgi:hypothetical protein